MTTRNIKKLERLPVEVDEATTSRVVDSTVIRGDISGLSPQERSRYYLQLCNSLGLNPATQPFAILKLNGKDVLYPTRGATDQLAAVHRLNREIIDGPKVIELAGTKMVYALCRATHPNGRVETAVATLPLTDPLNALMKCETKAKRRATLSILGLGMLDEMEFETIPSHLKSAAQPIEINQEDNDEVSQVPHTSGHGHGHGHSTNHMVETKAPEHALPATVEAPATTVNTTAETAKEVTVEKADKAEKTEKKEAQSATLAQQFELPASLAPFLAELEKIQLPAEGVQLWLKTRGILSAVSAAERDVAFRALCKRTEDACKIKNAKVLLRKLIADEIARKEEPENNQNG